MSCAFVVAPYIHMTHSIQIRSATQSDAEALLSIYRPAVELSAISFETVAPTVEEFAARIAKSLADWQWLVATRNGICVGYARGAAHRTPAAYRWSVEVSAYVHKDYHRQGIGRALYLSLFEELAGKGFCNAYAGVALPNDSSIALHRSVGFESIGTFRRVGWKFGRWHDVAWFHKVLRDAPSSAISSSSSGAANSQS